MALSLLFSGVARSIHLNDIDIAIGALWRAILDDTDELVDLIDRTSITIDEWHRQKQIYAAGHEAGGLALGFATLFLNRTNRSGIIKGAGVIGGLRQTGNYLLDCRFNKADITRKIRRIATYRRQIRFTSLDAVELLAGLSGDSFERALVCADPPYYGKGSKLYTSFYRPRDHAILADAIMDIKLPWITTYDDCPEIQQLYRTHRRYRFEIQYSAQTKRLGDELLIASKGLRVPSSLPLVRV